jgi:hypothetical protein
MMMQKNRKFFLFLDNKKRERREEEGYIETGVAITIFSGGFSILPSTIKADPDPETGMPLHLLSSQTYGQKRDIFNDGPRITFTRSVAFDPNSNDIQIVFENLPLAWRRTPTNST